MASIAQTSFDHAKTALVRYFQTCMEGAGLNFTGDNQTEIESIVDDLEDGMNDLLEELKRELKREIEDELQLKWNR